jgi:hypothetical protein
VSIERDVRCCPDREQVNGTVWLGSLVSPGMGKIILG